TGRAIRRYRYTLTATDNVGNTTSIQTTVKVDTSDPTLSLAFSNLTGATALNGSPVYFPPNAGSGGSFDVTASGTDNDTDIAGYKIGRASWRERDWTAAGAGARGRYYFSATDTSNGNKTMQTTNKADRTGNANIKLTTQSSGPR